MSVGIVIVTHGHSGEALIEVAEFILDQPMTDIRCLSFCQSDAHTTSCAELRTAIQEADEGDGILILTDLLGASPANLLAGLLQEFAAVMVAGINLAMLLRVWNYRQQPLPLLTAKAIEGGKRGIEVIES